MDGELNVLDTRSGKARHLSIQVPDDGLYDRPSQVSAADDIEDAALSPKGERALFAARGDIFTAPIEKGVTRNLTRTSGAHDKWPRWSPDGRKIAFISDRSGEEEIWLVDQDGSGKPEQLTNGGKAMRYAPEWSPDGKRLAFSDKDGRIWVADPGRPQARRDRARAHGDDPRLRLVARRQPPRLLLSDPNGFALDLDLERRRTASCAASPTRCSTRPSPPGTRTATTSTS